MTPQSINNQSSNPLAVYAPNPRGVCFENQEKGERIILMLRQHLITQLVPSLEVIFLALIPFVVTPVVELLRGTTLQFLENPQLFWIVVFWYLFVFGFAFYKFIFWYFNVYMLTSERVVDFDFKGILHMETAYTTLNKIQDVTPKVVGFGGTFFHYGNVFIQTASEVNEFEFLRVARPEDVAEAVLDEVRNEEAEAPGVVA